jgi:transcriptional regulator with XRE-family HTH domain
MTITRTAVARETARRMRRLGLQTGEDIRRMRLDVGITLTGLAEIVGVDRSHLARLESGTAKASIDVLTAIGVALGADLSLRYFPGSGPRLHDRFQAPMLEAVLAALDPRWRAELEVPVTKPSRGVIDLVLKDRSSPVVVAAELQSELRRLEQQIRWTAEKADGLHQHLVADATSRAGLVVSRLLILRSTMATRELARQYASTLSAAYPALTENVVSALTTPSTPWPGAGIVWVRIEDSRVTVLGHPPRGVTVGR